MKLGISVGHAGAHLNLPIKRVQRAEELGFDSVWASEIYSSDAITPLAFIAAHTQRIRLGTGIAVLSARSPANMAMCAQTIDALAGGDRMIVGLGVSGPQVAEGWYGQPWGRPNHRLRDYVAIMKMIWKREGHVAYQGDEISLPYTGPGSTGLGKPLKSVMHGNPNIPVFLGTATPTNIRMTAEVADGWISMHQTPYTVKDHIPLIEEGLARRTDGKTLKDFVLRGSLSVHVDSDVKRAIDERKQYVALFAGGMGAKEKNFHKDAMIQRGFAAEAERVQELFLAGRKVEAAAAVPDEYVDDESLIGPPERIKQRWKPWLESGLNMMTFLQVDDEALEILGALPRD
jgi:F420-dependent oxidoreductase-like protein